MYKNFNPQQMTIKVKVEYGGSPVWKWKVRGWGNFCVQSICRSLFISTPDCVTYVTESQFLYTASLRTSTICPWSTYQQPADIFYPTG